VHSSRCTRAGGLFRGLASGVDAVGSSTVMVCGRVQTVAISPLARDTAMGTGGRVSIWRPALSGSGTSGSSKSEVTRSAPVGLAFGSGGATDRRAPAPPS
jgi:hypothetical protein